MNAEQYERAQQLFSEATALPESDRTAFVEGQAGGDAEVRDRVLRMLDTDRRSQLLDRDLADVAAPLIGAGRHGPDRIGPYRITRVIGEGGMGVVYEAAREDLGSVAAVKVLRDAWASPKRRDRFATEQRTLAKLNHPHIARLYDAGAFEDGTPWIVMEYVDGVPITEYCRERGLSVADRLRVFRDVCSAVQHAHTHLILHRDLKPSNILVGRDGTVKLLDFGIATELDGLETPTQTGLRLMTPVYASPERLRGDGARIDADVYSLGVVLYELLAGRLPFEIAQRSSGDLEAEILRGEPVRPSVMAQNNGTFANASRAAWADLDVLCLTAMHRDAERRYHTVDAFMRDIDRFLKGEPLEARPDSIGYRVGKFLRRRRREVAAAAVAFLVVAAVITYYTMRLTTARNEALTYAARAQRIQKFILNLFEGGDPESGPSDKLMVATLIDRGVQEARALGSEPEVQAEMYQTLGTIYQQLGNLERSKELLAEALSRRTALQGASSSDVARTRMSQALLLSEQSQTDEAERVAREALAMVRRHRPPADVAVIEAMTSLGKILSDAGKYQPAIETLGEVVRLQNEKNAEPLARASSLFELASANFYAGNWDESETQNQQALALYRQAYGDRHPMVSNCLVNLGAIQYERGKYPEAERFYREAIDITVAWYGRDHHQTAANLTMLARVLNRTNDRKAEAQQVLAQSLRIRERVYGPTHPKVASTLNEIATVAYMDDRLAEAERDWGRVLAIYRGAYGQTHQLIGVVLSNLASTYMAQKKFPEAEKVFRDALGIYAKTLPPSHTNVGITKIKLGRSLLRQKRFDAAAVETLAGYDILKKQMDPGVSWLKSARTDLIEAYDALKRPESAQRFRDEAAALTKKHP